MIVNNCWCVLKYKSNKSKIYRNANFKKDKFKCNLKYTNNFSANIKMHKNLRSFINKLREEKELIEIEAQVDPFLEIAEIHRRVIEAEGKALLFKNVKGSIFPVVTNLFGTAKRIELAF